MTDLEQRIVDQYLRFSYPDEPGTPIEDVVPVQMEEAQPVAPAPEPMSQPTGSIREIPRNMFEQALGRFGEVLTAAGVQLDKVGIDIPVLGRVTLKDLTVGDMGKVIEDMSYGFPPTRGAGGIGGTSGLKPEATELLNLPIVGTAARATGTVAAAGAKFAAPKVGEMLDKYMGRMGLRLFAAPEDYRGSHRAPMRSDDVSAPGFDMTTIMPDDIYSAKAAHLYGHTGGNDPMDKNSVRLIKMMRGKPEMDVMIFRAVPKDVEKAEINRGDWVTINKDYAVSHGESVLGGEYKILSKMVKAKDIHTDGNSIHEWGYDPEVRE
jgi:hypothetical protein